MMNILFTLRRSWKPTILSIFLGGTVAGVAYILFRLHRRNINLKKIKDVENDDLALDLRDIQYSNRPKLTSKGSCRSFTSRTSTISEKHLYASEVLRKPVTYAPQCDSDLEELSIFSTDFRLLGLRTLADVVDHLESLMTQVSKYEERGIIKASSDNEKLLNDLRQLFENAYYLREQYNQNVVRETDYQGSLESLISQEDTCSFFSTQEQLDFTELELLMRFNVSRPLYYNSLKLLNQGEIAYRALRTQFVGCELDIEYLAKMHCLRQAFKYIFERPESTNWIVSIGKLTIFRLLHCLGYPTDDFKESYERLIDFINSQRNDCNSRMFEELLAKGIKVVNFYDVVFDYMLLEAFELLANPPSTILSVTRHRWLSDNFKRCALDSGVWTILLAKRKLLKYPDGFFAHYYNMISTLAPALAWGFLGPDENLFRICDHFRELIVEFIRQLFNCYDSPSILNMNNSTIRNQTFLLDEFEGVCDTINADKNSSTEINSNESVCTIAEVETTVEVESLDNRTGTNIRQQTGLRFTHLPELALDLYNLIGIYTEELTQFFVNESALMNNNAISLELQINPLQPPLHY